MPVRVKHVERVDAVLIDGAETLGVVADDLPAPAVGGSRPRRGRHACARRGAVPETDRQCRRIRRANSQMLQRRRDQRLQRRPAKRNLTVSPPMMKPALRRSRPRARLLERVTKRLEECFGAGVRCRSGQGWFRAKAGHGSFPGRRQLVGPAVFVHLVNGVQQEQIGHVAELLEDGWSIGGSCAAGAAAGAPGAGAASSSGTMRPSWCNSLTKRRVPPRLGRRRRHSRGARPARFPAPWRPAQCRPTHAPPSGSGCSSSRCPC